MVVAGIVNSAIPSALCVILLIAWIVLGIVWLVGLFSRHRRVAPGGTPSYWYANPYHGAGVAALICFIIWLLFC